MTNFKILRFMESTYCTIKNMNTSYIYILVPTENIDELFKSSDCVQFQTRDNIYFPFTK